MDETLELNIRRDIQNLRKRVDEIELTQRLALWRIILTVKETGIAIGLLPLIFLLNKSPGTNIYWILGTLLAIGLVAWVSTMDERSVVKRLESELIEDDRT